MVEFVAFVFEALAFVAFVVLVAVVPYTRRKRSYWTSRGLRVATDRRSLATTLPGIRLDDRSLARYRDEAGTDAMLGLHDSGRPCALACDIRVATAALGNDGFAEVDGRNFHSLVPSTVDAEGVIAVLPIMAECVNELITSLEAVANRQLTVAPWTEVKKCAVTVVATCVYGQPMIDSRIKAFAEQCDKALRSPAATPYFTEYNLSSDDRMSSSSPPSNDFKRLFRTAAADSDKINTDVADKQVRLDMFEFVTGAIEPTAALVTAVLYELARDQKIQNLLREKLDAELSDIHQQITIEQLDRLPYLENVLRETLRKYPLTAVVRRVTNKPYIIPNSNSVTLEPGTLIVVPVHALHHDSKYFDAPESFQPLRFPGQLSSAYMPHGSGPQSYIGKHFVGLEAKLIVATMVSRYEVHVDGAELGRPMDPFDVSSFAGVRLKVTNRSGVLMTMGASLRKIQSRCNENSKDKKFLFF